jgi:hypothetical protein
MYVARCVFNVLFFFLIIPVSYGQQSVNSATVTGTIQDGTHQFPEHCSNCRQSIRTSRTHTDCKPVCRLNGKSRQALVRRWISRRLSGRVSYTFSKAIDNTGNAFFSSPQDNFNIRDDRGFSDNDQRHRLTVSGQVNVPKANQLSAIYTYDSPFPFNVVTGGQTLQTTGARVSGVGRNTGVGFNYASLDLRANRSLKIAERMGMEILVEAFNVLNRTNYQFPNNTFGSGTIPLASFR